MQPTSSTSGPHEIAGPALRPGFALSTKAQNKHADLHGNVASAEIAWPLLDISLVIYNSSRWLPKFFASLLAQGYPTDRIRVLAVDHGSQDDSFERLQDFARDHGAQFADVIITRQPNRGFGAGHNTNLQSAAADYFLVTNVDLEYEHDTLVRLVEAATTSASDVASWECRQKPFEHPKTYNPVTLETSWCSSACVLLRTEALRHVDGYDEKLFMYGEDVDLSYRLRDRGHRLQYCPRAVCWHHGHTPGEPRAAEFLGISLANLLLRLRFGGVRQWLCIPLVYMSRWWIVLYRPSFAWGLLELVPRFLRQAPAFVRSRHTSRREFPFRGVGYELARDRVPIAQQKISDAALPLVSIVIRTYAGRFGFLREAVQSVLNQTYPRIELIVVEDGETRFAADLLNACSQNTSFAIRYSTTPKGGRCRSGNVGLAEARGEYLGFLDDDDYFFADHVETLIARLLDDSTCAAAYSAAWEIATNVRSQDPLAYEEVTHRTIYRQPYCRGMLWQRNYIPIQSILFHRRLYQRHGGFDETLEVLEDWNLWTRYSIDAQFMFVDKTTSGYRVPADASEQFLRTKKFQGYYQVAKEKQGGLLTELDNATAERIVNEMRPYATPASFVERCVKYLRDRGIRATVVRAAREMGARLGFC